MVPISYFLIAWIILLSLYLIMAMVSVLQMVRFGIAGFGTYASTTIFIALLVITVVGSGLYFLTVDWSGSLGFFAGISNSPFLNP